ncbi:MAG TPA: hypothetical protein VGQ72_07390 [Pyrinomonadaceae bacterium]|nr:hypothetical protein [Pyrinomonadaceae bacterium]
MILWIVLFFLVIALVMFFHKPAMKSSMEKKLGRKVEDRELTSLTAWMEDNKGDQSPK